MSKIKAIIEQGAKVLPVAAVGAAAVWGANKIAKNGGFSADAVRVELEGKLRGESHQQRAEKSKENTGQNQSR